MRKETGNWWKQAETDLRTAGNSLKSGDYYASAFWCQQAAEKALKALLIKRDNKLIKVHDLVLLAKRLNAPKNIVKICEELAPIYVETRYPDTAKEEYTLEETEEDIKRAEEILKWVKKNL